MIRRHCYAIGVLLLALGASSCRPKPKLVVKAQRVVIKRISLKNITLSVRYLVKNPHRVALTIEKVDQRLFLNKEDVAAGNLVKKVKIAAKSSESLDVDVVVPFGGSLKSVTALALGKRVTYKVVSNMEIDTPLGLEKRTMLRSGEIEIPLKIGGGLVGIKNPALKGQNLTLDLLIKIPRPKIQMMATREIQYQFSIEGTSITTGALKLTAGSGDFQTVTVPVSWPLLKGVGWTSRVMLGQSLKTYFRMKMDLGDETDFLIENEDSFSLKKLTPAGVLNTIFKK
ncbi:LEA type 2 family protein [Myxococcota bacterium]|nr:LEA type 2 family protein [Myxococcota bacterium]MBU1533994.1 LEA type 2 family protein [Myxococcota bacterium]